MGCNCEKKQTNLGLTVEVVDDTGEKYTGVLYSSILDFSNWFTSTVSEFHLENNSKKTLGESNGYSVHSLPMVGVSKAEEDDTEPKELIVNLKQGNTYAYLPFSGRTWKLGIAGSILVESHKVDNVN